MPCSLIMSMLEGTRDMLNNISNDWKGSTIVERKIISNLLGLEATPNAIKYFAKHQSKLSDYWYWFSLGTLWISYSGYSDIKLWRQLLSSPRPNRKTSLMKPDEVVEFNKLPETITAYRAHRTRETDWISYTLSSAIARRFAIERTVYEISKYRVQKSDVIALFLRRGEYELITLNRDNQELVENIAILNINRD